MKYVLDEFGEAIRHEVKKMTIKEKEVGEKAYSIYSNSSFEFYEDYDGVVFVADNGVDTPWKLGKIEDVEGYLLSLYEEEEEEEEEPSYLFATIPAEDAARLTEEAKGFDDVEAFIQHVGYECWMDDFTDSPEGEPMAEAECDTIDEALREVWEEAHPAKSELPEDYAERRELALHYEVEELKDLVKMLDEAENEYYEGGGESIPLYRLRKEAGLTQAALAEKTGLLKTQISKYERGVASPTNMQLGTAAKLAKALGCHAEDLLEEE